MEILDRQETARAAASPAFVPEASPGRWEGIDVLRYKEEGTHFHKITRQILFDGAPELGCQLRYFEIEPGGHSTFERHEHVHAVLILRGAGEVLVGEELRQVAAHDLVYIPSMTWHQFQANRGEPLGFLCMVNCERDRPQRPGADGPELRAAHPHGSWIKL